MRMCILIGRMKMRKKLLISLLTSNLQLKPLPSELSSPNPPDSLHLDPSLVQTKSVDKLTPNLLKPGTRDQEPEYLSKLEQ